MGTLDDLPDKLVLEIIRSLGSTHPVGALSATSSRYNRLASDDSLWRDLYLDRFGASPSGESLRAKGKTWRWLYQARLPARLAASSSVGTAVAGEHVYLGDWCDGRPHGVGISYKLGFRSLTEPQFYMDKLPDAPALLPRWHSDPLAPGGHLLYEGEWREGRPDGFGIMTYTHERRYEGRWRCGRRHGTGTFTVDWRCSTFAMRLECEWSNGACHGRAKVRHRGFTWKGNVAHGFFGGTVELMHSRISAYGEWNDNQFDGTITWSDARGSIYAGSCTKGRAHGFGTLKHEDGRRFEASWSDGALDGDGAVTYSDGSRWQGRWKLGERQEGAVVAHNRASAHRGADCDCLACLHEPGLFDDSVEATPWPIRCRLRVFDDAKATE
ncbi:Morn repeat protein [Pandoravirus kuranda]|uniref:Morn repeat protein n=1 Tax=Pandoravirus kuranda TaxID=3019033 RepID=A0AA95ED60_9VIRU|nr:Morn repeat protein [Pandoravirus kuranda]